MCLWDALCQGLGDPSATATKAAAVAIACAAGGGVGAQWAQAGEGGGEAAGGVGAGVGQGAADETSLVGGMVVRNGVTGIVVQHSHSVCRVRYDSGVSEVLAVDDMLDWLI